MKNLLDRLEESIIEGLGREIANLFACGRYARADKLSALAIALVYDVAQHGIGGVILDSYCDADDRVQRPVVLGKQANAWPKGSS